MNQIKAVMTTNIEVISPECSVMAAAQKMVTLDVGALPVCDGEKLLGIVTDRDIVLRSVAQGYSSRDLSVDRIMSKPIMYCYEDQDVKEIAQQMEDHQIRRLVVLTREKKLCGVVTLGDLAVRTGKDRLAGDTLEKISEPTTPKRAA